MATTDVHGNVLDWDYFRDRPGSALYGTGIGLARASTIINAIRDREGAESVIVVDNGDTIQGTPLSYYYARVERVTATGRDHPLAVAYNTIGYDAQVVGNHDFNYGLDLLGAYEQDLDFPLLGANVLDATTGQPTLPPYTLVTRRVPGHEPVTVGVLGLTTPGSMVWDKRSLEGKVTIEDMVTSAATWVPRMKAAGADVVVVLSHAGIGSTSYAIDGLGAENAADRIAQVPDIDAIVMGHTHGSVVADHVTNTTTGAEVLLTQPLPWAQQVSEITFRLEQVHGRWVVGGSRAEVHESGGVEPDRAVVDAVQPYHDAAVAYINEVIATSTRELPAATSRFQDTAIMDYVQMVQTRTVTEALAGGPYVDLPVLSIVAPFSRTAVFPEGDVTVRDMAGLYLYDNTLEAVLMTGSQVKHYLEFSARYYGGVQPGTAFDPETHTGVGHDGLPGWDYNYDILSGVDYCIDLARPVGDRIVDLTLEGTAVSADQRFVVAVNSYRRAGGGNFPHISTAPVVYDEQQEIRQLLIDWASANGTIDPDDFFVDNWALLVDGRPAL